PYDKTIVYCVREQQHHAILVTLSKFQSQVGGSVACNSAGLYVHMVTVCGLIKQLEEWRRVLSQTEKKSSFGSGGRGRAGA
ncbi:hypothetical protein NL487_29320, partial [Klebsiella pneumoniae]|nr:hypothetical protein [Klebsiella pneumoniae]